MGYLITGMFLLTRPSESALRAALPESIEFRIYEHLELAIYAVEGFSPAKPSDYPLSKPVPTVDVPLELGPHLEVYSEAYRRAQELGGANGFKRAYLNLAELVSSALGTRLLAIFSDDDGVDFACIAEVGRVSSLWAQCETENLKIDGTSVTWLPLDEPISLHQNAAEAFREFTGKDPQIFGLGHWNPPDNFGLHSIIR